MNSLKDINLISKEDLQLRNIPELFKAANNKPTLSEWMRQQREIPVKKVMKEINEYLERKCEDYCKTNNISLVDWITFATFEHFQDNRQEVRYKKELVCGVKVVSEIKPDNFSEKTTMSLEMY